jgi:hypothetical protein
MELGGGMHGEQVAVGALFASFLRKDPLLDAMDACLHRHGVPRLPGDLGLTEDEFARAVAYGPSTRPDRYTVLEHLDLDDQRSGGPCVTSLLPSITDLRATCQPESLVGRVNAEHWAGRLYMRRVSLHLTRQLVRTPLSADAVTWLMIASGTARRRRPHPARYRRGGRGRRPHSGPAAVRLQRRRGRPLAGHVVAGRGISRPDRPLLD